MDHNGLDLETDHTETKGASQDSWNGDTDRILWEQFEKASTIESFSQSWLALQCGLISGTSRGLLLLGSPDIGPYSPTALWPDSGQDIKDFSAPAERALAERRGYIVKHKPQKDQSTPEKEQYHVAYPVVVGNELHGAIVLKVASRSRSQLEGALRQLHWGSAWLALVLRRQAIGTDLENPKNLQTVLDLLAVILGEERFYGAATAFVTTLATRFSCDRVSLGFMQKGRIRVQAISHLTKFDEKVDLLRAIGSAMEEAMDQRAVLTHPPLRGTEGRYVMRAHEALTQQYGSGGICSIPLSIGEEIQGILVFEHSVDHHMDALDIELFQAIGALAGPVLEIQRREDRWLIVKGAESFQQFLTRLIGAGHLTLKAITIGVISLLFFLALAKGDYRVTSDVLVEPEIRRALVAPFDGYIASAPVREGDIVRKGQVLSTLDDREITLERFKLLKREEELRKGVRQAMADHQAAQVRIISAQIEQVRAQLELATDRLSRTEVRAPIQGVVVTGDLSQSLGAPIQRGEVLFEVAPLNSYRLFLQVDEHDIADVSVGQSGHILLTGFPTDPLPFVIEKITPVSKAEEGHNYFRVEAYLKEGVAGRLRPGMEGTAKITIEPRRLIWIWTHKGVDWIRLWLWKWLP